MERRWTIETAKSKETIESETHVDSTPEVEV